jgi:tRNA U38,U39,U40 pseudouridine synthase TruA
MELREQLREENLEPNQQEKNIAALKNKLRSLMGFEDFKTFYMTTSFSSNILEKQLQDKLNSLTFPVMAPVVERENVSHIHNTATR